MISHASANSCVLNQQEYGQSASDALVDLDHSPPVTETVVLLGFEAVTLGGSLELMDHFRRTCDGLISCVIGGSNLTCQPTQVH
jgi:hypothetical protein